MTCTVSLDFLEEEIARLKGELEEKLKANLNNLQSPEVLEVNMKIDKLLIEYINLSKTVKS